jgi:hypothetical protein
VLRRVDGSVAHRLHGAHFSGTMRTDNNLAQLALIRSGAGIGNSPRCRVTFDALVKGLQQHVA